MIAIITGDIINSGEYRASEWMEVLKSYFLQLGNSPGDWEFYRGDEFQIRVPAERALHTAIAIKARIKTFKKLDVRMAIGLGDETYKGPKVSESNGTAYQRSGRTFERLKDEKVHLAISSGHPKQDRTLNLILLLALDFMNDWSQVSAEIMVLLLKEPGAAQNQIAEQLGIKQSAVSQRFKRARKDLVLSILRHYNSILKELNP
ncbi:SatD family protein [Zeaxanthinibacter sp. PT1]|uniref:SatD family protein n=1 Tax=Zeaxanthinibacter TaxID=561554 RepID=UPI00234A3D29|nr:SatD family protein [Zeaxanthinibacter sp. PT1]MDC6352333.1 SatD family protein [Zeaxanthinibacter sp. PT1]